jgi:hypothetical protein
MKETTLALNWIKNLSASQQNTAIKHLLEAAFSSDTMCLRMKEGTKEVECVYWEGNGESIAKR